MKQIFNFSMLVFILSFSMVKCGGGENGSGTSERAVTGTSSASPDTTSSDTVGIQIPKEAIKEDAPVVECMNIDFNSVDVGFKCQTSAGFVFERVNAGADFEEAWLDVNSGLIWPGWLSGILDGDQALKECRQTDVSLPTKMDFELADTHGFHEVLPDLQDKTYWFRTTNEENQTGGFLIGYYDLSKKQSTYLSAGISSISYYFSCVKQAKDLPPNISISATAVKATISNGKVSVKKLLLDGTLEEFQLAQDVRTDADGHVHIDLPRGALYEMTISEGTLPDGSAFHDEISLLLDLRGSLIKTLEHDVSVLSTLKSKIVIEKIKNNKKNLKESLKEATEIMSAEFGADDLSKVSDPTKKELNTNVKSIILGIMGETIYHMSQSQNIPLREIIQSMASDLEDGKLNGRRFDGEIEFPYSENFRRTVVDVTTNDNLNRTGVSVTQVETELNEGTDAQNELYRRLMSEALGDSEEANRIIAALEAERTAPEAEQEMKDFGLSIRSLSNEVQLNFLPSMVFCSIGTNVPIPPSPIGMGSMPPLFSLPHPNIDISDVHWSVTDLPSDAYHLNSVQTDFPFQYQIQILSGKTYPTSFHIHLEATITHKQHPNIKRQFNLSKQINFVVTTPPPPKKPKKRPSIYDYPPPKKGK
ncbi:MAG: hypothetical protein HY390_03185 [Deltaproteobacteria bacterium]|nr:hypothetical protein [Deltaproteobacteria bacterium]